MSNAALEVAALDAVDQAELVRSGQVSAPELVRWAIERIDQLNPTLNAVVTPMYERAPAEATTTIGPLAGVPYLLKDLATETGGVCFTEGSRFLRLYLQLRLRAGAACAPGGTGDRRQDQHARVRLGADV